MTQSKTMPHRQTSKTCQNCKIKFIIEPEDFEFYKKIDVPEPTFCPECRAQRRFSFRSGRILYKRKIEGINKEVFSCVSPKSPFKVYDSSYWWSNEMDAMKYGKDYDFNKPFFEQLKELMYEVGVPNLTVINAVNSPYTNNAANIKDCYLVFNAGNNENCAYCVDIDYSKDCYDNSHLAKCELCYEGFMLAGCYKSHFSSNCADCQEVLFSSNCINCHNCFGCVNLRHKKYHIFNKPYTKKEYFKKLEEFNLGSYKSILSLDKKAKNFWLKHPIKYMHSRKNVNVTGEDIYNSKNVKNSYSIKDCENLKYSQLILFWPSKDCYDITVAGGELCYEIEESAGYKVNFSWLNMPKDLKYHDAGLYEMEYSIGNTNSHHLFACVGLRHKQYCILNKQYTKEEYQELVPKIKQHMNDMPYIDKKGMVYKYGEFFPAELSPFGYNETIANEYFPLNKEQALNKGYAWYDKPKPEHKATIKASNLPDHIKDVDSNILKQVIECENCHSRESGNPVSGSPIKLGMTEGETKITSCAGSGVFRIIPQELKFYQKHNLPLPRFCPDCRHKERIKQRNPMKLHHRQCMNSSVDGSGSRCKTKFETTYAPDRKEIVYCEACYNKEVG